MKEASEGCQDVSESNILLSNKNEVLDASDESTLDSDDESRENLVCKIQKIKQKKQELINRLKLHEAVSQFKTSIQTVKPAKPVKIIRQKRKASVKSQSLPRRKSLRLLNVAASSSFEQVTPVEEKVQKGRLSGAERNLKYLYTASNSDSDTDNSDSEEINKEKFFNNLSSSIKNPGNPIVSSSSFHLALKKMNKTGCAYRKLVDHRIYTLDIHHRTDFLLVAAGSKSGQIGLWSVNEPVQTGQENVGKVCNISTYTRTVSKVLFPSSKPNHLYFSNYAGAVRSIDLNKLVLDEALIDDEDYDISTFALRDPLSNVIIAGCYSGDIVVRDSRSNNLATCYNAHDRVVKSISLHPLSSHYFSTSSNDSLVKIYDFRNLSKKLKPVSSLTEHSRTVDSAYFSPLTGNRFLTTSLDDRIRVYDTSNISTPKLLSVTAHNNNTGRWLSNFQAIWHPSREDIVAIGSLARYPRQIEFFDENLNMIHVLNNEENLTTICSLLAMHPSRHVIAGANSSGKVFLFES